MIYINFKKGQGLGNQLWLYASALNIAKKNNMKLIILNYKNFVAKSFLTLKFSKLKKKKIDNYFFERFYYDKDLNYISHFFDERSLYIKKNTLLEGYFQDERYLDKKKLDINKYIFFKNKKKLNSVYLDKKSCILNIRGGEYKRHSDLILPKNYWTNAIQLMIKKKITKFLIITDDTNYCKKLLPGYPIISGSIEKCFMYLYKAKNLIVSNSSFSYFPIYMQNNIPYVIAPGYWARHNSKLRRWASVSNYYPGWEWIDDRGLIMKKNQIIKSLTKTENMYKMKYNLLSEFNKFDHLGIRKYMPVILKRYIKKILSYLFPLKFG